MHRIKKKKAQKLLCCIFPTVDATFLQEHTQLFLETLYLKELHFLFLVHFNFIYIIL